MRQQTERKKLIDEVNVKPAVHYSTESSHVIETRSFEYFIFYPYEIVVWYLMKLYKIGRFWSCNKSPHTESRDSFTFKCFSHSSSCSVVVGALPVNLTHIANAFLCHAHIFNFKLWLFWYFIYNLSLIRLDSTLYSRTYYHSLCWSTNGFCARAYFRSTTRSTETESLTWEADSWARPCCQVKTSSMSVSPLLSRREPLDRLGESRNCGSAERKICKLGKKRYIFKMCNADGDLMIDNVSN